MTLTILLTYFVNIAIPALAVYLIFALDLYGTGKRSTVLLCVAWGLIGAYGISDVVNNRVFLPRIGYEAVVGLSGPITEEIAKALLLVYLVRQPRFRYIVDGAVYGFAIGIGFAVSENALRYLAMNQEAPLIGALSRVLSTTLMHATASALVGIALGRLRRARAGRRLGWPLGGMALATALHIVYNNLVTVLSPGPLLLLVAIGIGAVGVVTISVLMNQGLAEERKRFAETLTSSVGVSASERRAVQQLGGEAIEHILKELADIFGEDKIAAIRRLLVIQANIGILQNNLRSPASERLRQAWQEEIRGLRAEINQLRKALGLYAMSFLRGVFPEDDTDWSESYGQAFRQIDPTQIHSFDLFIRASEMAGTISPERLERIAAELHRAEIFSGVSLADLENLSRAITTRSLQAGEVLFREGDEGDTMFVVQTGQIDLVKRDSDGTETLLRTCRAGDMFGELALLDGYPRSASARARGPASVLSLRRAHFMMFIQSRAQVILAVLTFLANRVRSTTHVLETSIAQATSIARGDFQAARDLALLGGPSDFAPEAVDVAPQSGVDTDTALNMPGYLGGAFAKIALALEGRGPAEPRARPRDGERSWLKIDSDRKDQP